MDPKEKRAITVFMDVQACRGGKVNRETSGLLEPLEAPGKRDSSVPRVIVVLMESLDPKELREKKVKGVRRVYLVLQVPEEQTGPLA